MDMIRHVEAMLEDNFPYTLVPIMVWILFAWPLYLVAYIFDAEKS